MAVSDASKILFTNINFRGISGPNALNGIITSKIVPSFTMNTLDAAYQPHHGKSIFLGGEFSGLGGTVYTIRPIVQYKQFFPVNKRRNAIGYNVQGSFISGYNGVVAPPFERAYLGGENDLRGFDIRTVSPIAFLPSHQIVTLTNPDGIAGPEGSTESARRQLDNSRALPATRDAGRRLESGRRTLSTASRLPGR